VCSAKKSGIPFTEIPHTVRVEADSDKVETNSRRGAFGPTLVPTPLFLHLAAVPTMLASHFLHPFHSITRASMYINAALF
jgi:hypothetical protein